MWIEAGRWNQGLVLQPEGPSGALPTEVSHAKSEGHGSGGRLQLGSPAQERCRAAEFCLEIPRGLDATLASCPSQTWHSVDPPKEFRPGHRARLCERTLSMAPAKP